MSGRPAPDVRPRLDASLRPEAFAPVLARFGRLHLPGLFTPDTAGRIAEALAADQPWVRSLRASGSVGDITGEAWDAMTPAQRQAWHSLLVQGANGSVQYQFDSRRISDLVEAGQRSGGVLAAIDAVYDWLNSAAGLDFLRRLTGDPTCAYVDAQATRYRPGDFLGRHHDDEPGKRRLYAYVLNFTPAWRPDWGGVLQFLDADGHVAEGYSPAFNALNIFKVPQDHCVSSVVHHAPFNRLSITGWIRSRRG
ncbi:MAG: hypothetical protein EON95_05670 [Caulobacteraceae bacterium]|nr:MAG: hypothetical protein EON95_05670 [Caulobacteraceae bacterium]